MKNDNLLIGTVLLLSWALFAKGQLDGSGSGSGEIRSGGLEDTSTAITTTIRRGNPDDEDDFDIIFSGELDTSYSGDPDPFEGFSGSSPVPEIEIKVSDTVRCKSLSGPCWCIDRSGKRIAGTGKNVMAHTMTCNDPFFIVMSVPDASPSWHKSDATTPTGKTTKRNMFGRGREPKETTSTSHVGPGNANGRRGEEEEVYPKKEFGLFTHPGILAAIIGGGVVALLCALLLVMFVVYRMRKKDEGSYPLDPDARPPRLHTYTRAPNKEFYA